MNEPEAAHRPERRSVLIWAVLVLTLAAVMAAGLWSLFSPRRSGAGSGARPGGREESSAGPRAPGLAGESWKPAAGSGATPDSLPIGDRAPAFSLTERRGGKVTLGDLDGKVWIANFIFTSCGSVCPDLTRKMALVRQRLKEAGSEQIVSVTYSVDPVHDTPEVLTRYARQFHGDTPGWLFLTGDSREMLRVVNQGFHLFMADPAEGAPEHSDRFILVDAKGRVRTTHQGSETNVVDTIVREALALEKEAR